MFEHRLLPFVIFSSHLIHILPHNMIEHLDGLGGGTLSFNLSKARI